MTPDIVAAEVRRAIDILHPDPAELVEIRVPTRTEKLGTIAGFFSDRGKLAADVAARIDGKVPAIYVSLQRIKPALLAERPTLANRLVQHASKLTTDADVESYQWFPVDLDPVREAGTNATDAEHDAALARAEVVMAGLVGLGFSPDSILRGDSGNGAHALVRIDLAADEGGRALVQRALEAASLLWGDDVVNVDVSTFNPARVWKLYATVARKGAATPERPHRRSRLLHAPERVVVAPREALERLAAMVPKEPARNDENARVEGGFDVERWLADHGLKWRSRRPWQGKGTLYVLERCPLNPEDDPHAADVASYVAVLPSGAIAAGCHHDRCRWWGWSELREKYDPAAQRAPRVEWDDPVPLDEVPAAPAAPFDTLPGWLRAMTEGAARQWQVPGEFVALYALATMSGAIAGKFAVKVRDGWDRQPAVLYVGCGLPPSDRKSPPIAALTAPVRDYERQLAAGVADDRVVKQAALERAEARLQAIVNEIRQAEARRGDPKAKVRSRDVLDAAHTAASREVHDARAAVPDEVRLISEYATPEALSVRMAANHGRQIILSDEGVGVLSMPSRYSSGGLTDVDLLLKGYDGGAFRPDRVSRQARSIESALLAIAVGLQPDAIGEAVRAMPDLEKRGVLARFMWILPRSLTGWRAINPDPIPAAVLTMYADNLRRLLELSDKFAPDGMLAPEVLPLSREADSLMLDFEAELEPKLRPDGEFAPIRAIVGKLAGNAARLALNLHVADYVADRAAMPREIPAHTLERALAWARVTIPGAFALCDAIAAGDDMKAARRIFALLAEREWPPAPAPLVIKRRDILRATRGTKVCETREQRDAGLRKLADHGFVQEPPASDGPAKRGAPEKLIYVHPRLREVSCSGEREAYPPGRNGQKPAPEPAGRILSVSSVPAGRDDPRDEGGGVAQADARPIRTWAVRGAGL